MPIEQIRFGIIGLGRHGARYAEHLLRNDIPNASLIAVSRRDAVQGRAFAEKHGVRYYADADVLLADSDVDVVVVTTPPNLHAEITVAAANAGKHVLCEKPMARTTDECRDMIAAALRAGVKLGIGQTLRYTPLFATLRGRIGEVGELHAVHICMRQEQSVHEWHLNPEISGGGCITEIGVHVFDALRYVAGRPIRRAMVAAMDTHNAGVETYVAAVCWLDDDVLSLIDVAKCVDGRLLRVDIVGSAGQFIANATTSTLDWIHGRTVTPQDAPANIPTIAPLMRDFCDAIRNETTPPVSGEDGLYTLAVSEAFYRSMKSGRPEAVDV
jgi:predicted dehydrogenase